MREWALDMAERGFETFMRDETYDQTVNDPYAITNLRRVAVFRTLFFAVFAADALVNLFRARLYESGMDAPHVPKIPWLFSVLPAVTPMRLATFALVQMYLSVQLCLNLQHRWTVPLLCVSYAFSYYCSMLDMFQHHYMITLLMLVLSLQRWERPRAWVFRCCMALVSAVFFYEAMNKLTHLGDINRMLQITLLKLPVHISMNALAVSLGVSDDTVWYALGASVILMQLCVSVAFHVRDPPELRWLVWTVCLCFNTLVHMVGLRIRFFSFYMVSILFLYAPPEAVDIVSLMMPFSMMARTYVEHDHLVKRNKREIVFLEKEEKRRRREEDRIARHDLVVWEQENDGDLEELSEGGDLYGTSSSVTEDRRARRRENRHRSGSEPSGDDSARSEDSASDSGSDSSTPARADASSSSPSSSPPPPSGSDRGRRRHVKRSGGTSTRKKGREGNGTKANGRDHGRKRSRRSTSRSGRSKLRSRGERSHRRSRRRSHHAYRPTDAYSSFSAWLWSIVLWIYGIARAISWRAFYLFIAGWACGVDVGPVVLRGFMFTIVAGTILFRPSYVAYLQRRFFSGGRTVHFPLPFTFMCYCALCFWTNNAFEKYAPGDALELTVSYCLILLFNAKFAKGSRYPYVGLHVLCILTAAQALTKATEAGLGGSIDDIFQT